MKNLAWVDNDDLSQLPQFQSPEQLSSSDDSGGIVGGGGTGEGDQTSFSTIPQSSIIPVKSRRGTVRFNRERLGCLWSIPILVISIFSILVIITAIGVWIPVVVSAYATVQEGSKTNRDFRQRLIVQYSLRIASQAHSVIDLAYQYLYWDKSLLRIHEECESRLRKVLHSSIYSFNMINRLNYASSNNGKLTGVINSRPVASLLSTIVYSSNHNNNNNNNISILARYSMNTENGELGQFQQIEQESNNEDKSSYDSRLEPWYQMTTDTLHYNVNGSKIWNKYSIDFNAKKLITSISRPIYEQHKYLSNEHSGHLLGVLSATIHLDQLSDYLSQIQHYGHGTVFILDSEGYLIACNERKVMITHNNNYIRLKGDTHSNRFIREASNRVLHNYIIPNKLVYYNKQQPSTTSTTTTTSSTLTTLTTQSLSFAMGGKQVVLRVSGIRDDYGLQWIIVVSSSHEQMYSKVKRANIVSGIVALISLLLSIVGSILVGFIITKPLNQLSQQMYRVALMDFENYANSSLFTLYEFAKMGRALNRMKEGLHTFSIYVPGDVVRQILSKGQGAELGLTTKTLTILICDIVNSTNMCENTDPIILIGVMQDFFTITNDIIADNEGTVDKYIGDCVMAIFNAPTDIVDHQLKAIRAAVKISTKLEECNLAWARKNYPHIAIRTGINTAKCLVGNVGAPQRMNYTALGEGVNIANLLEKFNNRYRTKILIGENTFRSRHVQETFSCRWIDFVKVRGIQRPFNIYEIRGYNSDLSNEDHHITHMHQRIRDHLLCGRVDKSRKLCDKISNYPIQLLNKRLSTIHHNQNSNRLADDDDAQLYYEFNESVAEYDQSIY